MIEDKKTGYWSAQCLGYDIATQAKTLTVLLDDLQRMIAGHIFVSEKLTSPMLPGFSPEGGGRTPVQPPPPASKYFSTKIREGISI